MRPSFRRLIGYLWVLAVLLGFLKISRPDVLMAYFENLISQIFFSFLLKCYQVILVLVPTFVELKKNPVCSYRRTFDEYLTKDVL